MIAKQYSVTAGDYYWRDLNMVDFEISPYYASEAVQITDAVNISEDEAYEIACNFWDYSEDDASGTSGSGLRLVYDGLLEKNGKHYYAFRLRLWVAENNHMSTADTLYINAETGECSYYI